MKKLLVIALLGVLAFSCAKDPINGGETGNPGDVTLRLSLSDFGQVDMGTRAYDPNAIVDMTILQFVEGKCVVNTHIATAQVSATPTISLKSMTGNTPGNVVLVFCNFAELNGGADPFVGIVADNTNGDPIAETNAITANFNATNGNTSHVPIRGIYTNNISAGTSSTIDITLGRMFAKIAFKLVNSFPGFTPTSIQLCDFGDKVGANGLVPTLGATSNLEGFVAFPSGASYTSLPIETPSGIATSNHSWSISENCMGTWNDVELTNSTPWSNFFKFPGAASNSSNYDTKLNDAGFYNINGKTPYVEVKGVATITSSGVPAMVTYKIYLGSDADGDMNILGNYIYNVTTTITGINGIDSRITTTPGGTAFATPLAPSNCYMINANSVTGTPAMKLGIPAIQAQYGQNAISNITAASANTIDYATTSVGVVWQTMSGSSALQSALSIGKGATGVSSDPDNYYIIMDLPSAGLIHSGNNAVIALYSGANQTGTILWSWHLWFTDYQPNPNHFNENGQMDYYLSNTTKAMMDRNLGSTITGITTGIANRMSTDATWAAANAGKLYGLLYQWGRKDPFTPADGTTTSSPVASKIYDKTGTEITNNITTEATTASIMLGTSVAKPSVFFTSGADWYDTSIANRNDNLWTPGSSSTGNNAPSNNPINNNKSIFDPCPPGWRVPSGGTIAVTNPWTGFNGFKLSGSVGNPTTSYTFGADGNTTPTPLTPESLTIFQWYSQGKLPSGTNGLYSPASTNVTSGRMFSQGGVVAWYPASGSRFTASGAFTNLGSNGYSWSSSVNSTNGYNLSFTATSVNPANSSVRATGFPVRCIQE